MSQITYELAAYSVKDDAAYKSIQEDMHKMVSGWEGYISSMRLQSVGTPTNFADIAVWTTEALAKEAAKKFDDTNGPVQTAAKAQFGDMVVFGHFFAKSSDNVLARFGKTGAFVEIAASYPGSVASYEAAQVDVHQLLKSDYAGVIDTEILKGDVDGQGVCLVDLISWESPEDMKHTFEAVSTDERFAAFFTTSDQPVLCELYVVTGLHGQALREVVK